MLYAIQATDGGPVKFGRAANPQGRMASMASGNPKELRLVASCATTEDVASERAIHELCKPHRIRGEWFDQTAPVVKWVVSQIKAGCAESAVAVRSLKLFVAARTHNAALKHRLIANLITENTEAVKTWALSETD